MKVLSLPRELREAAPDFLAARMGARPRLPHPLAATLDDDDISLSDIALSLGNFVSMADGRQRPDIVALSVGMTTDDFKAVLADTARAVIFAAYDGLSDHLRIVKDMPVRSFAPVTFPAVDLSDTLSPWGEDAPIASS